MTSSYSNLTVGIVDDSPLIRQMIAKVIEDTDGMQVIGQASNPLEAREMIKNKNPDVITLDIEMPKMNGIDFLEKIMRLRPMPVIMVSTLTQKGASITMQALEMGAIDAIGKPQNLNHTDLLKSFENELIPKLRAAKKSNFQNISKLTTNSAQSATGALKISPYNLITIASSTGGIERLRYLFSNININTPPIVVVQHINKMYTTSMVERMQSILPKHMTVKLSKHRTSLQPNTIYMADNTDHILLKQRDNQMILYHQDGPPLNGFKASADHLFNSCTKITDHNILGLILSGMGHDGAHGMMNMRKAGIKTIGESKSSCLVYGMSQAANNLGALDTLLSIKDISKFLNNSN